MDTYLVVASKRDERSYGDRPIPDEVVERILDAGRLSGSAKNRQPWRFVIVEERRERLAPAVYSPERVLEAPLVVAVTGKGFDLGRACQNMMLAAWNEGIASCPTSVHDPAAAAAALDAEEGEVGMVIGFGYPARPRDPESRPAEEWSFKANRQPLAEFVTRL